MNRTQLTPRPIASPPMMNRAQRRRAAKRKRKAQITRAAICAAVTLTAGVMFGGFTQPDTPDGIVFTATSPAQIYTMEYIDHQTTTPPATQPPKTSPLLASVPMDEATQRTIYEMCGENPELFCTVMAIAKRESRFDPEAVGDDGDSIGMMQINTWWQYDRIERLGITDLTDTEQNMAVAIDFLWWIADRLAPEHPDSVFGDGAVFMVYNCGLQGASSLWEQGIKDTAYSRECLDFYRAFMAEMEVRV